MDTLVLASSVLASEASANKADLPGCCQVGLLVVGFLIWGAYRLNRRADENATAEQTAAEQATEQAKALTIEERHDWERRIIEHLYSREPVPIGEVARAVSQHDQFVLNLIRPILHVGDLEVVVLDASGETQKQLIDAPNESTVVQVTPQGALRLRERGPVVNNYGDTVHAHGGSTVNSRSVVINSFNSFATKYDEETAAALAQLESLVRQSGDVDAQDNLDLFLEEVQRESPRRSVLRSLFYGIQQSVPTIAQAGDILLKVRELML